jgi:hypothetical protein
MNQKDYCDSVRAELAKMREELEKATNRLTTEFSYQLAQAEILNDREEALDQKVRHVRYELASKLSDLPERYMEGASHLLSQKVVDQILEAARGVGDNIYSAVWREFNEASERATEALSEKLHAVRLEQANLEGGTYKALLLRISDLKRDISLKETHLSFVSDLSHFRQFAKDHKEGEVERAQRKMKEDAERKARLWVKEHIFKEVF